MPKVFISYRYEDSQLKSTLNNWEKHQGLGEDISFKDLDEKEFETRTDIQNSIREEIKKCQVLLVLVGSSTSTSKWVDFEIQVAQEPGRNIRIIWTRLPIKNGETPPRLRSIEPTPFSMVDIQKMVREGGN